MSGHDHGPTPAPIPHVLPMPVYLGVFAALIGLTIITVATAQVDLGPFNLPLAMVIATTKATLVAAVFMHLWFDNKLYTVVLAACLLFVGIFIVLTWADLGTRDFVDPVKQNYLPRAEKVEQYLEEHPEDTNHKFLRPGLKNANSDEELKKKLVDVDAHAAGGEAHKDEKAEAPKGEAKH